MTKRTPLALLTLLLIASSALARPTACSLDGRHVGSANLDMAPLSHNLFVLEFNPATDCEDGGAGR